MSIFALLLGFILPVSSPAHVVNLPTSDPLFCGLIQQFSFSPAPIGSSMEAVDYSGDCSWRLGTPWLNADAPDFGGIFSA